MRNHSSNRAHSGPVTRVHQVATRADQTTESLVCAKPGCRAEPQRQYELSIPVCKPHLVKLIGEATEILRQAEREYCRNNQDEVVPITKRKSLHHDPIVYYLKFGDRIKIGTSTRLIARLQSIPYDKLLAVEPGDFKVEGERHRRFAHVRVGSEWFNESPDLMAHIRSLGPVPKVYLR